MTDNEIIKALGRCAMRGKGALEREVCGKCPYYNTMCCEEHLLVDSVLLINRQKAEIEKLGCDLAVARGLLSRVDSSLVATRNNARAEAIKEFAERLKEALYRTEFGTPVVDVEHIDNLVKEMVGDDNG